MKKRRTVILGGAICATAALVACQNGDKAASRDTLASEAPVGTASPIENYKQQVAREAMEGLTYESGRVELDVDNPRIIEGIGEMQAAQAKYEEGIFELGNHNNFLGAIRAFSDAVIMMPDQAPLYVGLGRALDYKGKPKQAEAAYRTALELNGNIIEAQELLAANLYAKGQYDEAIGLWNTILDADANHAEAHGRLALAYYYEGEYAKSLEHLNRAEQLGREMPTQFRPLLAQRMNQADGG